VEPLQTQTESPDDYLDKEVEMISLIRGLNVSHYFADCSSTN